MKILLMVFTLGLHLKVYAIDFFSKEIDYWNQTKEVQKKEIKPVHEIPKKSSFEWDKFKNPENKEFFKEGEYTPPEPFMELARNPTNENIKNWLELMEAKNKLMARLQEKMQEYIQQKGGQLNTEEKTIVQNEVTKLNSPKIDVNRFRFLLYFESSCPHCHHMLETMKELQGLGYYVEIRQIDNHKLNKPIPFAIIPATKVELAKKDITSWPVLFVADTTKQVIYRINGYKPTAEVLSQISQK